jgi:transposase
MTQPSKELKLAENIRLFPLLPYTPETDPIEQIWKEIRKIEFKNETVRYSRKGSEPSLRCN